VRLGAPRVHRRALASTSDEARKLAAAGAPHGTLVTADEQHAGRGRQGRTWSAPAGRALLMSLVLRDPPRFVPLAAGVAVADTVGPQAQLKWPNDVWIEGRKVAGILVEGRLQEGWVVLGIGVNVAVDVADLPPELAGSATTLGRPPEDLEPFLAALLAALEHRLTQPDGALLDAWRERDALRGRTVAWADGRGAAAGIDDDGRLVVATDEGDVALAAGEVHLHLGPVVP